MSSVAIAHIYIVNTIIYTENSHRPHKPRSNWIDNLRAFIIILVVAHHAALSYPTWAYFNKTAYILSTHPIVDAKRSAWFDIFINFNDSFFMGLMFLISGIFVVKGLQKKGTANFIRDRFFRLLVLFLVGVTFLMPVAYYAAFHIAHPEGSFKDHLVDFFTTEGWPVGPPWFLWVLFLFNVIFALVYRPLSSLFEKAADYLKSISDKPFVTFLWLAAVGLLLYLPAMYLFGAESWTGYGPFDFQKSRLLLYFGYFVVGCIVGANGTNEGVLKSNSHVNQSWAYWVLSAIIGFTMLRYAASWLGGVEATKQITFWNGEFTYRTVYIISATLTMLAFITFFNKFVNVESRLWKSLAANSFGIYLLHYIFVVWMQYLLLFVNISAGFKFAIVFIVAFGLSWMFSNFLRKIELIRAWV